MEFLCSFLFVASMALPYNNISINNATKMTISCSRVTGFSLLPGFLLWDISWYFLSESSWCVPGLVWRHHVVETLSFGDIITREPPPAFLHVPPIEKNIRRSHASADKLTPFAELVNRRCIQQRLMQHRQSEKLIGTPLFCKFTSCLQKKLICLSFSVSPKY